MSQVINDTYCRECGYEFVSEFAPRLVKYAAALCAKCGSDDLDNIGFDDDGGMDTTEAKANGFHPLY